MVTCQAINEVIDPNFLLRAACDLLGRTGLDSSAINVAATLTVSALTLFTAWLVYVILTRVVARIILRLVHYTGSSWDDLLFNRSSLRVMAELLTAIYLRFTFPPATHLYPKWSEGVMVVCKILVVFSVVHLVNRLIIASYHILEIRRGPRVTSLKGIRQMLQVISIVIGLIITASILANRDPLIIISGLGAAATVLMLVFKDPIMGVVAGVQLTLNDMLRPGDWISVPSRDINGVVREVGLTTVKVQNFDMTIVTVPPYALLTESFQNWRGMTDSGGRRVTRSVCIDINSVRFLTPAERKNIASEEWSKSLHEGEVVNLTAFRHYLRHYVMNLANVCRDMTYFIREFEPTPQGVPVEIYVFTSKTAWAEYEEFQADLLDSVLASVHRFGLRIYQAPSGHDILSLKNG